MATIETYLDWRGDLTLLQDPFNEVDNLILCELVYTDFDGIVPMGGLKESISLREVYEQYFQTHTEEEIMSRASSTKVAPFLMHKLVESKRFGSMRLAAYRNEIEDESQSQFAAVTYILEDNTYFVCYRGTDNTIVGWKEDFNMSFLTHTRGQLKARDYLDELFGHSTRKLRVGGHSKGGNFAIYAAAFCSTKVRKKISVVYSNDGPGFREKVMESSEYQSLLPLVVSTIPEDSIVGNLLLNDIDHQVVRSSASGASQHDLMSWEVMGNHFMNAEETSRSSKNMDRTLKLWLMDLPDEKREVFSDVLFQVLSSSGAKTTDELSNDPIKSISEMMKATSALDAEDQKIFKEVLMKLLNSGREAVFGKWVPANSSGSSLTFGKN
ncbi:MAG: DUF2974 domain-containing protein [Lachnospiraceae bacterium]|nr:DUF2974 domain-containing protein [Lachnospiraceae bacterium]